MNKSNSLLHYLLLILLIISLFKLFVGDDIISFGSFLEYLSTAPSITISTDMFETIKIVSDWGLFNFLRDFINLNILVLEIPLFISNLAFELVKFVLWGLNFIL